MTNSPTPRLVPDRPSDAAIARALLITRVIPKDDIAAVSAYCAAVLEDAKAIDAAAPPAEAPAERGANHADTLSQLLHSLHDVLYSGDWSLPDDTHLQLACAYEDARNGIGTGFIDAAPASPAEGDAPFGTVCIHDGQKYIKWTDGDYHYLDVGTKLYTTPRVTGGREDQP